MLTKHADLHYLKFCFGRAGGGLRRLKGVETKSNDLNEQGK
jgi:hypothetical protein